MVLRPSLPSHESAALASFRRKQHRRWLILIAITGILVGLVLVVLIGCQPKVVEHEAPPSSVKLPVLPPTAVPAIRLDQEPVMRVRIRVGVSQLALSGGRQLTVGPMQQPNGSARPYNFAAPLRITRHGDGFAITSSDGKTVSWALSALMIHSPDGQPVQVDGVPYPQQVALHLSKNHQSSFDAVNHVLLEQYLPGVLQKELYRTWHPATFRAQCIAARSYAICQHVRWQSRHYDLESTTASQAYAGAAAGPKAVQAVALTRGIVLTYQNQVVPGYYSSCCGAVGQDATVAFPNGENMTPLRGRQRAAWCRASSKFQWGPITRRGDTLSRRIRAWGWERKHPVGQLQAVARIDITSTNAAGRPAAFTITDRTGSKYALGPEEFRFACNFDARGVGKLGSKQILPSSFVTPSVSGNVVRFQNGRGYGHGVGMCQWGAQGMASAGIDSYQIVAYYYPQSQLRRLY